MPKAIRKNEWIEIILVGAVGFMLGGIVMMNIVDDNLSKANKFFDENLAWESKFIADQTAYTHRSWLQIADTVAAANSFLGKAALLYRDAKEKDKIAKEKAIWLDHEAERWEKAHAESKTN